MRDHPVNLCALVVLASALLAASAPAQGITDRVIRVAEPAATVAAVSDRLATLAVGVRGTNDYQVALFGLDARGAPTGAPQRLVLPVADSLKAYATYALGLAFHPRLPLLYVWRDIAYPASSGKAKTGATHPEFDHLVVVRVAPGGRAEVGPTYARDWTYAYGQASGRIAVDDLGRRIYLPNLATPRSSVGYLRLDTNGLPRPVDGAVMPVTVDVADVRGSTGLGFVALTNGVLLMAGWGGPALWDTGNRRAGCNTVSIRGAPVDCLVGGVPGGTSVYGAAADFAYRMEHADGYLTLMPQTISVPGASFSSPPVVMSAAPARVAVGGAGGVYLIPTDAEGRFAGAPERVAADAAFVRAMAYAERFDRLYVAVNRVP